MALLFVLPMMGSAQFAAVNSFEGISQAGVPFGSKEVPISQANGCDPRLLEEAGALGKYHLPFSDSTLGDGYWYPEICPNLTYHDGKGKNNSGYFARQTNACTWADGKSNMQYARLQNWCTGVVRAFHWHDDADEWGWVEKGNFTTWLTSPTGMPWEVSVADVTYGGVWYFPRNWAHTMVCNTPEAEGGCSVVLVFSSALAGTTGAHNLDKTLGQASENATGQDTDEVPAQALGVSVDDYRTAWLPHFRNATEDFSAEPSYFNSPQVAPMPEGYEAWSETLQSIPRTRVLPAAVEHQVEDLVTLERGVKLYQIRTQQFPFATTMSQERAVIPAGGFRRLLWLSNADGLMFVTKGSVRVQLQGGYAGVDYPLKANSKTHYTQDLQTWDLFYFPVGRAYWIQNLDTSNESEVITVFNVGSWHSIELREQLVPHIPEFMLKGSLSHVEANMNKFDKTLCQFNSNCANVTGKAPNDVCCPGGEGNHKCCEPLPPVYRKGAKLNGVQVKSQLRGTKSHDFDEVQYMQLPVQSSESAEAAEGAHLEM
ncbi:unnamed protein product [Effrenium voratum]|nr:unnamed protein product [Effrenium voratum]